MWPASYWPPSYWPAFYWPKGGPAVVPPGTPFHGPVRISGSSGTVTSSGATPPGVVVSGADPPLVVISES
jgi:hypothetical protein